MDTNKLRKSRTTQAVQLLAAAALLVTLTQAANAHDEDRWYQPREHDWHGGVHRDWHSGGRHYDWHRGAHHDWYGGGHDD